MIVSLQLHQQPPRQVGKRKPVSMRPRAKTAKTAPCRSQNLTCGFQPLTAISKILLLCITRRAKCARTSYGTGRLRVRRGLSAGRSPRWNRHDSAGAFLFTHNPLLVVRVILGGPPLGLVRRRRPAAEPYRVVLLTSLTSPEPGFMLVRGGGMGNRHEIRYASGRRRKANSYP
jgi:hypothetical protein